MTNKTTWMLLAMLSGLALACSQGETKKNSSGGFVSSSGSSQGGNTTSSADTSTGGVGGTGGAVPSGGNGGSGGSGGSAPVCPTFDKDVRPVLVKAGCSLSAGDTGHELGCHQMSNPNEWVIEPIMEANGPSTEWVANLLKYKTEETMEQYLVPGDPGASLFLCNMQLSSGTNPWGECGRIMPETSHKDPPEALNYAWETTPEAVEVIAKWIACGALNN